MSLGRHAVLSSRWSSFALDSVETKREAQPTGPDAGPATDTERDADLAIDRLIADTLAAPAADAPREGSAPANQDTIDSNALSMGALVVLRRDAAPAVDTNAPPAPPKTSRAELYMKLHTLVAQAKTHAWTDAYERLEIIAECLTSQRVLVTVMGGEIQRALHEAGEAAEGAGEIGFVERLLHHVARVPALSGLLPEADLERWTHLARRAHYAPARRAAVGLIALRGGAETCDGELVLNEIEKLPLTVVKALARSGVRIEIVRDNHFAREQDAADGARLLTITTGAFLGSRFLLGGPQRAPLVQAMRAYDELVGLSDAEDFSGAAAAETREEGRAIFAWAGALYFSEPAQLKTKHPRLFAYFKGLVF